ncbi:MAG: tetratricopeptide repeat protein [Desulfobulbus sp.]|nr:tetratricopeptide repeat protein [Desulfobulbus sp.]
MKKEASECVTSLLEREPGNEPLYYLAGQIAEKLEYDFNSASNYYGVAVSKNPENQKYILSFGTSLFMQRRYDTAIAVFSKLIEINSAHGEAYYYRGLCLESMGNREKAIEDMQLAALYGPKIDEARAFVEKYGRREPQKPTIDKIEQLEILANDNFQLGRIAEAEKQYQEITTLNPKHDRAWYQLGEISMGRNDIEQALRYYSQAIDSNKENDEYLLRRGFVYKKMNKFELAEKDYSQAILIKPKGYSYIDRARCYKELKEYKKSEQDLLASLQYKDGSANSAFVELGVILPKTGTKIKFTPENKQILLYRAFEYFNQGKFDLAKNDYQVFLKIDPDNDDAYHRLGMLLFEKMKNTDEAILNLSKAIEKKNGKNVYYLDRGRMYFAKNDFLKAKDDFSKVIELSPNNGWGFLHRGDCYKKLGQKDLALEDYKKAKQVDQSLFHTVQPEDMLK